MGEFTRSFIKIVPSLRQSTSEAVWSVPVLGEKLEIPAGDHKVGVYLHRADRTPAPVLFELHGGGFVLGEAAKDDNLCEIIKDRMNIHVVGIDYSKAPEHPYPQAVEDVMSTLAYFGNHAELYGMDPERFVLMGFSAGANLAAVASMISGTEQEYKILAQILQYPFLDATADPRGKKRHPADLPCEIMEAFNDLYAKEEERSSSHVSPLLASGEELAKMPETLILTAEEDALCEEGMAYAKRLEDHKIPVTALKIGHAHHGYIEDYYNKACYEIMADDMKAAMDPLFGEAAQQAMEQVFQYLKDRLEK